jgi:hypothetical protein
MPRKTTATAATGTGTPESDPTTTVDSIHKYNIEEAIGGPIPAPPLLEQGVITTATTDAPESIQMTSPYQDMLKREYDHAVDEEIRKGIRAISERFTRLYSQERHPTDTTPHDTLGNNSDYYERIMTAYQSGNWQALASTTEDLYTMLYDFQFTEMRKIEAIKQEYNQQS